jgi:hypothetical protein
MTEKRGHRDLPILKVWFFISCGVTPHNYVRRGL